MSIGALVRRPKLRVGAFVLRDGSIRLGLNPDRSYVLTALPTVPPDVVLDVLSRLDGKASRANIVWYAGTRGMSAPTTSTLLAELAEFGLLVDCATTPEPRVSTLHIVGRGPLADAVQHGLTASTIAVTRSSNPPRRLLRYDEGHWRNDLVVLADDLVADPQTITALAATRTPHLQIRLRDGVGIVGPFVLPGVSTCLRCLELTRSALDPQWPYVSAQLLGRTGDASGPTVLATAAFALAQIDACTKRDSTPMIDTTLEIDLASNRTTTRRWSRHPRCDCAHE